MTQWTNGIDFPQEPMLLVRPCLVDICVRVRPAAKMLSALLYHARNCTDDTFHLYRSQSQLVSDTADEVCEKTLCNVATPVLQLLGYIEADAKSRIIHYTIHLDQIRASVMAYKKGLLSLIERLKRLVKTTLETVLMSPTLETVLMSSIETVLMSKPQHKNQFQCTLEPVLKTIRDSSNVKRGRKPKPQEPLKALSEEQEIERDYGEIDTRDITLTNVSDSRDEIADAHQRGYPDQTLLSQEVRDQYARITAMDEAFLAALQQELSTRYPHPYDEEQKDVIAYLLEGEAHPRFTEGASNANSVRVANVNKYSASVHHFPSSGNPVPTQEAQQIETAQPTSMQPREHTPMATTESALQATLTKDDTHVEHATMAGTLFPASIPVLQEAGLTASAHVTKKPRENKKVDPLAKCDTREVHQRINERRGYALEERVDVIRENQAIKTWCHLHELPECDKVLDYLQERDPYWSKPENKYRIGGITLLKETPRVLAKRTKAGDTTTESGPVLIRAASKVKNWTGITSRRQEASAFQ